MRLRANLVWTAILLFAIPAEASFVKQELNVPGSTLWVSHGDLDRDGRTDLVVSYRRGAGPKASRFIAVFFRGESGYSTRPDVAFAAPRNAALFDVGNAFGDEQDEIAYLTPSGVYAQSFVGRKPGNPTRIVEVRTLIGRPEEEDFVTWDFMRRDLLLVPAPDGLHLYKKKGSVWKPWGTLDVTQYSYYDAETPTYRRSRRGASTGRPYAFRVTTIIPNIDFIDQTGDGKVDVVTHFEDRVAVYPHLETSIASKPAHQQWLSVRTKADFESRDADVSALVKDFSKDGIADVCITKLHGGVTNLSTELHLFLGKKGGGFQEKAAQVFVDQGFAALAQFADVDADGQLELVHPLQEVSIMALSKMMISSELTLELRIRRESGRPKLFTHRPVQVLETTFGLDLTVGATILGTAPIFGYDFDGDGKKDVILAQGANKMALHRGIDKEGLFEEEGRYTLSAPGSHKTLVIPPTPGNEAKGRSKGGKKPDLLVYYVGRKRMGGKLLVFKNAF